MAVLDSKPSVVKAAATSESLLLETYGVKLPEPTEINKAHLTIDSVSVDILRMYHPVLLSSVFPAKTVGDGNCMYRSVSKALTGTESFHVLLRLLSSIEILTHPQFYDTAHRKHIDLVKDNRIVPGTYKDIIIDSLKINAYSSMMHMYALSAALGKPIRSYYPPQLLAEFVSEPHTRKVVGRSVNVSEQPIVTLMWTQMIFSGHSFSPNHFVPLISLVTEEPCSVVTLDESYANSELDNVDQSLPNVADQSNVVDDPIVVDQINVSADNNCTRVSDDDDESEEHIFSNFIYDDSVHPFSSGCLHKSFLDVNDLLQYLQTYNFSKAHQTIPSGVKSDVFFVVQNAKNLEKRSNGLKSSFSDDCGVWNTNSGTTPKTYYVKTPAGELKTVFLRNGLYCFQKKVKGKRQYVPLEPQPAQNSVLILSRHYTTLKLDSSYKKRVSWLNGENSNDIAVVEYLGNFPGLAPHGNSKRKTEYVRTPAFVMNEMSDLLKNGKPTEVYNKLSIKYDELSGPTSKRQVYDKKLNDSKKDRRNEDGHVVNRRNIADHISEIDKLVANGTSIVKSIVRDQGKAPCLILYTDEQMTDIKNLCCTGQSILGIDKTFNLCDMHVTATCYKQVSVVSDNTGDAPIFLGPLFIHDNSDFESYSNFFNHLRTKLAGTDKSNLVFGSDEEQALVNAVITAFPESTHLLCKRHLYQNTKQKLIDDCVDKADRQRILDMIFGNDGLINADESICFDAKSDDIEDASRELSGKFHRYFQNKLKSNLKEKVNKPLCTGLVENAWTNNNSESLNHILKQAINWKSKPLLDLVNILTTLIEAQFKDIRKAIVGTGQFRLAKTYEHFGVTRTVWVSKTTEERDRHYKRLRQFIPKDKMTVTSTDGKMTVVQPRSLGKKIGQHKRKINERTKTFKKTKTK